MIQMGDFAVSKEALRPKAKKSADRKMILLNAY